MKYVNRNIPFVYFYLLKTSTWILIIIFQQLQFVANCLHLDLFCMTGRKICFGTEDNRKAQHKGDFVFGKSLKHIL